MDPDYQVEPQTERQDRDRPEIKDKKIYTNTNKSAEKSEEFYNRMVKWSEKKDQNLEKI